MGDKCELSKEILKGRNVVNEDAKLLQKLSSM